MTIVSKENIPITTSAMNLNEHSSSTTQALVQSTEKSGLVKEAIATKDVVVTMESVRVETSVEETMMNVVEELVSKKRLLTDTLATTNKDPISNIDSNEDVGVDDENIIGDNHNEDSPAAMTESSTSLTADDQQCEQDMRDNSNNNPSQSSSIVQTNTSTSHSDDMTQPEEPMIDLQRPVKRARTAYFLFLDDYRSTIQKEVIKMPMIFSHVSRFAVIILLP
jgi:hypothetical protein